MKDFKEAMVVWLVAAFLPSALATLSFWIGMEEGKRSERRLRNAPVECAEVQIKL